MSERSDELFDPADGRLDYLFIKVANHIAARIRAGQLPAGARLPNERHLSAEYDVSIGTIRRATTELSQRGLARVMRAKGTYIAPVHSPFVDEEPSPGGRRRDVTRADGAHTAPFPS